MGRRPPAGLLFQVIYVVRSSMGYKTFLGLLWDRKSLSDLLLKEDLFQVCYVVEGFFHLSYGRPPSGLQNLFRSSLDITPLSGIL